MFMNKNSPLTPFMAHEMTKMIETGLADIFYKRHAVVKPICRPDRKSGLSLGMEKLCSLFVLFICGCGLSLIVVLIEKMQRKISNNSSSDVNISKDKENFRLKIQDLIQKLEDLDLDSNSDIYMTLHLTKVVLNDKFLKSN